MADGLLDDRIVQRAVSRIAVRAERQENVGQLVDTFVDPGIGIQLDNDNNQIIYGRRGTGKTHVLKVAERQAQATTNHFAIYVDMRTLGSNSVFADEGRTIHVRVTSLLKDILAELENGLLDWMTRPSVELPGTALEDLDTLSTAITRTVLTDVSATLEESAASEDRTSADTSVEISTRPALRLGDRAEGVVTEGERVSRTGREIAPIYFQEVTQALRDVIQSAGIGRLMILLDEWTAVPLDLQPLLAEFLKRAFFTIPQVTVKIASLEYRSKFSEPLGRNNVMGFELGADISSVIELDDYYVYDRSAERTVEIFAELLFRHITAEAEAEQPDDDEAQRRIPLDAESYVLARYGLKDAEGLIRRLFASEDAFKELVRAGEGVARDFINIFSSAFFSSVRRGRVTIDVKAVQEAAREWYEKDKAPNIDEAQEQVLRTIIENVIAERRARSFLLEKQYEKDPLIMSLFDFRLLHLEA